MSNLYVTEPTTNGKVIFDTTAGEIEVELWGKEAPKAVRNFLQHVMEGYYEGVIFHRIVPGFIIQTGDPTGTGMGGDSVYGEPFEDEIHGRLKFNRRGIIGMANRGKRNTNTSQFFFTLDKADELTGRHTMFGKIVGNTVYNVLDIGQLETDEEERPKVPPKIRSIRIIENPFDDIVPRITAAERRAQAQARIEAKKDAEQREKRAKAKKNTALLSFGEAEEITPDQVLVKKKGMSRQDLIEESEPTPKSKKAVETFVDLPESMQDLKSSKGKESASSSKAQVDLKAIRAEHQKLKEGDAATRSAEIKRMQESLRALKKRTGEASDSDSDDDRKRRKGPSYLEQELAKYSKGRGRAAARGGGNRKSKREEEDDLLAELGKFSKRVTGVLDDEASGKMSDLREGRLGEKVVEEAKPEPPKEIFGASDPAALLEPSEAIDVDDDVGWMNHSLKFEVDEKELTRRAEDEYAVIDPRAKARELAEQEQKSSKKGRRGGDSERR